MLKNKFKDIDKFREHIDHCLRGYRKINYDSDYWKRKLKSIKKISKNNNIYYDDGNGALWASKFRKNNPDKITTYNKRYYEKNKDKLILKAKQWALVNKDKITKKQWCDFTNEQKQKRVDATKLWRLKNKKPIEKRKQIHTTEEFIYKANLVHNNKYNYSKSIYINQKTKIIIICQKHGEFLQTSKNHISYKQGCRKCGNENRRKLKN